MKQIKLKDYFVYKTKYDDNNFLSESWQLKDKDCIEDGNRIVEILNDNGYECSLKTAIELWQRHSDSMDGSWLYLYKDDKHNLESVMKFIIKD